MKTFLQFIKENKVNDAEQVISEIKSLSTGTYRDTGLFFGDNGMAEIYIKPSKGMLEIGDLISFKKGGARWILENIISICNKYSVSIMLLAQSYDKNIDPDYVRMGIKDDRPELSQKDLVKMYQRFGFNVVSKSSTSTEMVKHPD
jgi:hypothetical protein